MSNVAQIIEGIRKLARTAREFDFVLDQLHGIDRDLGLDYFDLKTRPRIYAANPSAEALQKYLNSFDLETLRRIEALIYSGRGDGTAVELRQQLAENHSSKEDIVRTIMEKRLNFDPYFDRGLDCAKADGIDLDTF